jgi:hypothetical protein
MLDTVAVIRRMNHAGAQGADRFAAGFYKLSGNSCVKPSDSTSQASKPERDGAVKSDGWKSTSPIKSKINQIETNSNRRLQRTATNKKCKNRHFRRPVHFTAQKRRAGPNRKEFGDKAICIRYRFRGLAAHRSIWRK